MPSKRGLVSIFSQVRCPEAEGLDPGLVAVGIDKIEVDVDLWGVNGSLPTWPIANYRYFQLENETK